MSFLSVGLNFTPGHELNSIKLTLQGLAFAGGSIAWMLWVTKIAPPEYTAEYMSIHTFTTGLRGVVAPALGFYLLVTIGNSIAIFSAILITLASVVLIPEIMRSRKTNQL